MKQKHYQAWLVVNAAQGKSGTSGRLDALEELNDDKVPLIGVNVSNAYLRGIHLNNSVAPRSDFSAADLRESWFDHANLSDSDFHFTNFRRASLKGSNLERSNLNDADLWGADLSRADLSDATLDNADLRDADFSGVSWQNIRSLKNANLFGVRNAPKEFVSWALAHGAVQLESEAEWEAESKKA